MKIYTGKGDEGRTSILGPDRVFKDDLRIIAYGSTDELNSIIGLLYEKVTSGIRKHLEYLQNILFEIGSDLASVDPMNNVTKDDIVKLENIIDQFDNDLPKLTSFILPGGSEGSSWLHLARTVTRRSEREITTLSKSVKINNYIIPWINRLSDLFFVWARINNQNLGIEDVIWESRKS